LSYTWGDNKRSEIIEVNGLHVNVTYNLWQALVHLREIQSCNLAIGPCWWINSVCIDQDNDAERGHQVGMMRDIFENAALVVAWLGPGTDVSDRAMETLNKHDAEAFKGKSGSDSRYTVDRRLFFRSFWTRIWIVQELCVAKQVVFACGHQTAPWDTIRQSAIELTSSERERLFGVWATARNPSLSVPAPLFNLVQKYKEGGTSLCDLIRLSLRAKCTDPRDRVFSLLGLAQDSSSKSVIPDYTLSPCDVFCAAARAVWNDVSEKGGIGMISDSVVRFSEHQPLDNSFAARQDCNGRSCRSWECCSSFVIDYCYWLDKAHDSGEQYWGKHVDWSNFGFEMPFNSC
jgi:hypothetical protein